MLRLLAPAMLLLAASAAPVAARTPLGVFGGWGAFEEAGGCFAIAETARRVRGGGRGYVTVTRWPARGLRGQVYFRLTRPKAPGEALLLSIGDRRVPLVGGGRNAWAADARADRAIVALMRFNASMSVEGAGADGRPIADTYRLSGAASAIDASALACLGR